MSRIDPKASKIELVSAHGSFNLLSYLSELIIYENIFRPALTASIMMSEGHNLPYYAPIVGEETINVDISIKDFENDKIKIKPPPFHVNSIKDREMTKPKAQLLCLDLVSEKFMSDSHAKVSRSYRNKTIGEIVANIHNTYLDDGSFLYVEPTDRNETCIIPNLSPLDAINWLAQRAIPRNAKNNVNYLFYETVSGSFFVSLNALMKYPPLFSCRLTPRVDDPKSDGALNARLLNIDKFKFINTFNKYKNTKRGVYASKLITHDIVKKKIIQHENHYISDWVDSNHLGHNPPMSISNVETKSASVNRTSFGPPHEKNHGPTTREQSLPKMIDSRVEFYPKHDRMYSTWTGDSYDNKAENWKLQRNSNIGFFQGTKIYVEASGVSSVRVGQIVDLQVPSTETTSGDGKGEIGYDKALSGNFMITAIKHIFSAVSTGGTGIEYRMGLELSKDGLEQPVSVRKSRKEG